MNEILLSIIIPAYNSGMFLAEILNVLVDQNLDLCEVVIINDGSIDNTELVCKEFADKYTAISYVTQENKGVSAARNAGLKQAKGQYVYFFDSDDSLKPGTLDFFKSVLLKICPVDMFMFGYEMRRNGSLIRQYVSHTFDKQTLDPYILQKSFFSKKIFCNICSCIYYRDFLVKNGIDFRDGLRIGEDAEFIIKSIFNASGGYYRKRISFVYQLRESSATQGYNFNKYDIGMFLSFELRRDLMLSYSGKLKNIEKELNFYIANLFLSHVISYLRSDLKNNELNKKMYFNKDLLRKPIKGLLLNSMAIYIMRYIPFKPLFKLFKK